MPEKSSETVQVLFPCVHGLARGQFVTINCFPVKELKSAIKVVTGIDEEIAGRVIGAARYNETDSRAGQGVMVLFSNPLFNGESYALALAVADKLARFEAIARWNGIYATGRIPADGCGQVDSIGDFIEKLDLMLEYAKPGSVFLYPTKNHALSGQISEKLAQLKAKGIKCMGVALLDDLNDKLWQVSENLPGKKLLQRATRCVQWIPSGNRFLLALVIMFAAACLLFFFMFEPHDVNFPKKTPGSDTQTAGSAEPDNPGDTVNREKQTSVTKPVQVAQKVASPSVSTQKPVLESSTTDSTPY